MCHTYSMLGVAHPSISAAKGSHYQSKVVIWMSVIMHSHRFITIGLGKTISWIISWTYFNFLSQIESVWQQLMHVCRFQHDTGLFGGAGLLTNDRDDAAVMAHPMLGHEIQLLIAVVLFFQHASACITIFPFFCKYILSTDSRPGYLVQMDIHN